MLQSHGAVERVERIPVTEQKVPITGSITLLEGLNQG